MLIEMTFGPLAQAEKIPDDFWKKILERAKMHIAGQNSI